MKKLAKILVLVLVLTIVVTSLVACGGSTIEISSDGYWVIDGVKTDKKAIGENGVNGIDGDDGVTPIIEISSDGYWVINGSKTDKKAIGENGINGIDGVTPTIEISADGYWVINGNKTEYRATTVEEEEPIPTEPTEGVIYVINDDGESAKVVGYAGSSKKVKIADTFMGKPVTRIHQNAFAYTDITYIDIPEGITYIDIMAFNHCYLLEEIYYNATNADCDSVAFSASGIKTDGITVHIGAKVESIPGYLFSGDNMQLPIPPKVETVIFEEGSICKEIGFKAFANLYLLESIIIPDSVTSIGYGAFENCTSLTIYCEAESKPDSWVSYWNGSNCPVVWGYNG